MEDEVSIRIRLRDAMKFKHDADKSARAIDNIGDQASKAARKLAMMNSASSKSRVSLGPFSTSMRGGALAVGAFALATGKLTPAVLGAAEATATLAGGAGGAGGVGLLALAQGAGVAQLGIGGLTKALGGNAKALKGLGPEVRGLYDTLHAKQQRLQRTAAGSMLPGLASGAQSASQNFGVLNRLVGSTGRTLGGLGADAGRMLGSAGFGADLKTVGTANVHIIDNLGHAGLNLADSFRHISVEAAPLAQWLSEEALRGSQLADVWLENARNSGKMAKFFRTARTDMTLLASATGHTGTGLINLFGAHDVNGTNTLRSLDTLTARFERWTRLASTQRNVGDAVVAEIPKAVGALMTAIANNLPGAGATAARVFFEGFIHADIWGQLLAGGFLVNKLGLFKLGKKIAGRGGGAAALGLGGGRGSVTNPLYVIVVNERPGGGGAGGPAKKAAGWFERLFGPGAAAAAARGLKTGGQVGATVTAAEIVNRQLGLQHRQYTPGLTTNRVSDTAGALLGRFGHGPRTAAEQADAVARVHAVANQMRAELGMPPLRIDNRLYVDGNVVAKATHNADARRNARVR